MIAIALSCDPKLLIADEPTTALDVTVQASVLDLLDDLRHEYDMSMIIITHDMGVVAEAADDIIVMYAGPGGRARIDARPLRQPRASLHGGAARRAAAARGRERARGAADRDPGPPARPASTRPRRAASPRAAATRATTTAPSTSRSCARSGPGTGSARRIRRASAPRRSRRSRWARERRAGARCSRSRSCTSTSRSGRGC